MDNSQQNKLVYRRVRKGFNRIESGILLGELLEAHSGTNLIYALVYNEFATQLQAEKLVASL